MGLSFYGAGVALVLCFTMELVASTPRLPPWARAHLLEFIGPSFSDPMGDALVVLCSWHAVGTVSVRPECAETGLLGRSPTTSVGYVWTDRRCGVWREG